MCLNINHTSQNHFKSLNNDHYVHRAACYLHFLMGQVRSKHPDLLTSLARHTDVWDLCLAGVPDSSGNSYKPEFKGQGFWLTELTQRSPLTRLMAPRSLSDQSALQYSQRNNAQTENSWLISHLKIISGCMLGWLNEKIRIPHSNWSPYCEYQMKTFRNLPSFHRITPPLFRKKNIHLYRFLFQHVLSCQNCFQDCCSNSTYNGWYNGRQDKKKQNKTASQIDIKPADGKRKDTNVIWADSTADCFCCSFSPKHLWQCNTVRPEKKPLLDCARTETLVFVRKAKGGCDRMIAVGLLEGIWSISIRVLICCELLQAVVGGWLLWDCLDECLDQSALLSPLMRSHCSSTQTHKPVSAFQMNRGFIIYTQAWTGSALCITHTHPQENLTRTFSGLQCSLNITIYSCSIGKGICTVILNITGSL